MATSGEHKVIGGFRVLKDLKAGAGSQGTVYQAVCETPRFPTVAVGDVVALKVMAVQDDDGEAYARLEKRTAGLVSLDHKNIVKYHGCFREPGPFNDVHVLVLEFVEGHSLKTLLERSPCGLGVDVAMRISIGLLEGLAYTSSRGIVHRDIKPGNVIVRPDGTPKLIDFEVARREGGTATVGGGNMIGTFDYMAPDFTDAEFRGDVLSDVFSMGVLLHEMLTGRTPYRRQSGTTTQANVAFLQRWLKAGSATNPLRVSQRVGKLLPGVRDVLERALSPERERRLADFRSFREALRKVCYRELAHGGRTWRLLSYIGHGGFGEVFGAVDRKTGERVAVKHLLNAAGLERFRREAKAMQRVEGSCYPRFIDWFQSEDGGAFLVMEYLDGMPGQSLKDVIKANPGRPLDRGNVLTAFIRYAHGLADLHALGLVHRDVKPANLYFPAAAPERAVVMDLGIARELTGTATVGQVPGTVDYMPPECVTGQTRGGPEADVWALGLCLYEALSGKTAYPRLPDGQAAYEAYFRRVNRGEKPDLSGVADGDLRSLLTEMCAIDPKKRIVDVRIVERRLRIANGENPENLPVPTREFEWREAEDDADFVGGDDVDAASGATVATVWGGEDVLARARAEYEEKRRRRGGWLKSLCLILLTVLMLVGGGYAAWRYAERQREMAFAEAEARAKRAAEEASRREEQLRREREDAERQKAAAEAKAEAEAKAREEVRARELAAEKAKKEAQAKAEAAVREKAEQEAARRKKEAEVALKKSKEEAERAKAEALRLAKEKSDAEAKARLAQESADRAKKAEEARLAKERAERAEREKQKKAEEERLAKERDERLAKEKAAAEKAAEKAKAEAARLAREKAAAEAEKERLAREVDEESSENLTRKLKKLDGDFAAYVLQYEKKRDEATKPGSRLDPEAIQVEYLKRRAAYRAERKKILQGVKRK